MNRFIFICLDHYFSNTMHCVHIMTIMCCGSPYRIVDLAFGSPYRIVDLGHFNMHFWLNFYVTPTLQSLGVLCLYLTDAGHNLITTTKQRRYVCNIQRLDYIHYIAITNSWLFPAVDFIRTSLSASCQKRYVIVFEPKEYQIHVGVRNICILYWLSDNRYSSCIHWPD